MSPKPHTHSKKYEEVERQVAFSTPKAVIEAICVQMERADEAAGRIEKEGSVVRDLRGAVIAHPSILIEQNAVKLYTDLLKKWEDKE